MNLILFEKENVNKPLPLSDERAKHILKVLNARIGDALQVGLLNGPTGLATLKSKSADGLVFDFTWNNVEEPPLDAITLIVGLSRPHTCQKVLQQATTMGVKKILFVQTELGEKSYAESKLWTTGDYKRHLVDGAQQAGSTRLPKVEYGSPLWIAMHLVEDVPQKIALHNGGNIPPLPCMSFEKESDVVFAIGSERGWTDKEIALLERSGFLLASMGNRVLRTETAVVSALALLKAQRGKWG